MISLKPQWVEKILNGEKTIEVRKSAPKELPFRVYVYCTKGRDSLVYSKDPEDIAWCKPFIDKENNRVWTTHNSKLRKYCKDREWNGKVVAEFIVNKVVNLDNDALTPFGLSGACMTEKELLNYGKGKTLYSWHIADLKIYEEPLGLGEFRKPCKNTSMSALICNFCEYAKRKWDGEKTFTVCRNIITRPPQSWQYVRRALYENISSL